MEFPEALKEFLTTHGKTLEDLRGSLGLAQANKDDSVPEDVGSKPQVVQVTERGPSRSYRRLRLFSGKTPVPAGELDFENWRRLARQLLRDESIPDREKKSRVTESLVPPALNIVWAVEDGSSAQEHVDCLARAYGSTADGDELLTSFRCTYQLEEEKASDYLLRLHTLLTQVIEMGGIEHEECDRVLCSQFQRGCLYNDPLLNTLQLQAKKKDPPGMLVLLREVRAAEALLEEKSDRRKGGPKSSKRVTTMAQTASTSAQEPKIAPSPESRSNNEIQELRQAVDLMTRRLDGFFKSQTQRNYSNTSTPHRQPRGDIICYNCGENGHRMDACRSQKNPALVQDKIIARQVKPKRNQSSGNGSGQL